MVDVKERFNVFTEAFGSFFQFVASKLQNFRNLTLGEQIAYCGVGVGLLLLLVSLVLFVVM